MWVRRAQSMVELAVALPLLVLIIAIALDFARVFQVAGSVASAARVTAEFGATQGFGSTAPPVDQVCKRARQELGPTLWSQSQVVLQPVEWETTPPGSGMQLAVTVTTTFYPITPMARSFVPSGQEITRTVQLWRNFEPPSLARQVVVFPPPVPPDAYVCPAS